MVVHAIIDAPEGSVAPDGVLGEDGLFRLEVSLGGADWIKLVRRGLTASATIDRSVALANPWHDELGRFAEKGTYRRRGGEGERFRFAESFGRKPWDDPVGIQYLHTDPETGEESWTDEDWALKHYGALETAFAMTAEERTALRTELEALTGADIEGGFQRGFNDLFGLSTRIAIGKDSLPDMPADVILQLAQLDVFARSPGGPLDYRDALDGWGTQIRNGTIDYRAMSTEISERFGVSPESAAVSLVHSAWADSSSSPLSRLMHRQAAASFDGLEVSASHYGHFASAAPARSSMADVLQTTMGATIGAASNSSYRLTQEMLADARVGSVRLQRGADAAAFTETNSGKVVSNPLSSWTTDESVAVQFATEYSGSGGSNGTVIVSTVQARDVWGWHGIGAGSTSESEYIVLGRPLSVQMEVLEFAAADDVIFIDDDKYGGPDWIKKSSTTSLTIDRSVALANPWHDELGRFAEKGIGRIFAARDQVSAVRAALAESTVDGNQATESSEKLNTELAKLGGLVREAMLIGLTEEDRDLLYGAGETELGQAIAAATELVQATNTVDAAELARWAREEGLDDLAAEMEAAVAAGDFPAMGRLKRELGEALDAGMLFKNPRLKAAEKAHLKAMKAAQRVVAKQEKARAEAASRAEEVLLDALSGVREGFGTAEIDVVAGRRASAATLAMAADAARFMPAEWAESITGGVRVNQHQEQGGLHRQTHHGGSVIEVPENAAVVRHEMFHAPQAHYAGITTAEAAYLASNLKSPTTVVSDRREYMFVDVKSPIGDGYLGRLYGATIQTSGEYEVLSMSMEQLPRLIVDTSPDGRAHFDWLVGTLAGV